MFLRKVKEGGSENGNRFTPLILQFAIYLRKRVNLTTYEFLRNVFYLPSNRHLMRYTQADTTGSDGACLKTILQAAESINAQDNEMGEMGMYGKISFDAHTIRGKFGKWCCLPSSTRV